MLDIIAIEESEEPACIPKEFRRHRWRDPSLRST
jgi:hypothetical protein